MSKEAVTKPKEAEDVEVAATTTTAAGESVAARSFFEKITDLSNFNVVLITSSCIAVVMVLISFVSGSGGSVEALKQAQEEAPTPVAAVAEQRPDAMAMIERKGEGRHFYTTIKIPPGAETLYLSGSGAAQKADGTWGSMEEQAIDTFNSFKATLEAEGWSMADIVQVRAFAKAGEYGLLDFDGFNRGYREFFGTEQNPMKPVRSFVQIADLVVPGWLVEIEIRAARVPTSQTLSVAAQ